MGWFAPAGELKSTTLAWPERKKKRRWLAPQERWSCSDLNFNLQRGQQRVAVESRSECACRAATPHSSSWTSSPCHRSRRKGGYTGEYPGRRVRLCYPES